MRRKCEYGVFQITNAKNLVKSRVEDEWFVRNFWHEWFGKPHTHNSDLTVLTLLKTTNIYKVRKNSWNCCKVLSKTHVHTLHFTKCWVKLMYTLYKVLSKTHVHTLWSKVWTWVLLSLCKVWTWLFLPQFCYYCSFQQWRLPSSDYNFDVL